jgi:predicted  nucleic acid-binding Zn-ribbon protein
LQHTPAKAQFMTQAEALYHLQEFDLVITQSQKRLAEIAAALSNNQILVEAKNQVQIAQNTLSPLQTKSRNLELEIQSNSEKIRTTDEQLYSGRVRNPKELQEMQQEIQSLKNRNLELEDVLLDVMLNVENAEAELYQKQASLEQLTADWESDHQHLLDEQKKLQAEVEKQRQKREGALPPVEPETLKIYNTLRPKKNNQPVALLINGSCSVCRVEQDMAVIGEVRKGQKLTYCVSCGRILAYKSG